MLRRDLTHALLLLLLFRPPQYGKPNLAGNFGYLGELDLHEVCDKHGVDLPIGNQTRNECYYQLMKSSGVTGAGKNVRAPEYVRKAARSAFDYDGPGLMPKNHFDAYMGGINIDVDEIQVAIHLMLAGVDVGEEAIHPDGHHRQAATTWSREHHSGLRAPAGVILMQKLPSLGCIRLL